MYHMPPPLLAAGAAARSNICQFSECPSAWLGHLQAQLASRRPANWEPAAAKECVMSLSRERGCRVRWVLANGMRDAVLSLSLSCERDAVLSLSCERDAVLSLSCEGGALLSLSCERDAVLSLSCERDAVLSLGTVSGHRASQPVALNCMRRSSLVRYYGLSATRLGSSVPRETGKSVLKLSGPVTAVRACLAR